LQQSSTCFQAKSDKRRAKAFFMALTQDECFSSWRLPVFFILTCILILVHTHVSGFWCTILRNTTLFESNGSVVWFWNLFFQLFDDTIHYTEHGNPTNNTTIIKWPSEAWSLEFWALCSCLNCASVAE
jgi:hypothetical protein